MDSTTVTSFPPQPREGTADAGAFARIAVDLRSAGNLEEAITRVLRFARQVVPCDFSEVNLAGGRQVPADQLQLDSDEGPWASPGPRPQTILVLDTAEEPRWPLWGQRAAELGVRSLLSIQLSAHQADLGFLSLYSVAPGRFAEADIAAASLLAQHAAVAINAVQIEAALALAVETRTVVGSAQGILMERFALNADQAFAVLQKYSQDKNIKLYDAAARLAKTRQLPDLGVAAG